MDHGADYSDHHDDDNLRADAERSAAFGESGAGELSSTEIARLWSITPRALRFYESRGLISPRREGRARIYGQSDSSRIGLILKAKKLGFTLTEIGEMIAADAGGADAGERTTDGLHLTAQKCLDQIARLEAQMKTTIEALADLRRIHLALCRKAGVGEVKG